MRKGILLLIGIVLGSVVLFILIATLIPAAPGRSEPLRSFYRAMDIDVQETDVLPPTDGVLVLEQDFRTTAQAEGVIDWVREGGRLIVTDPGSTIVESLGVAADGSVGVIGASRITSDCVAPATMGVPALTVDSADSLLDAGSLGAVRCYAVDGPSAYYIDTPQGNGTIAALGGVSFVNAELISTGTNARFAYQLLRGRDTVTFGPAAPPGTTGQSLWQSIPDAARAFLWQLLIGAVVIAVVAGRQLGRSRDETPLSPIPSSELLRATSGLYRSSQDPAHAAGWIREWAASRIAGRVGLPLHEEKSRVAAAAVAAGIEQTSADAVLLEMLPTTEPGLSAFARRAEKIVDGIGTDPRATRAAIGPDPRAQDRSEGAIP